MLFMPKCTIIVRVVRWQSMRVGAIISKILTPGRKIGDSIWNLKKSNYGITTQEDLRFSIYTVNIVDYKTLAGTKCGV